MSLWISACLCWVSFGLAVIHAAPPRQDSPKDTLQSGDIVFQDSSPHSGQAAAIKALTRSQWSHCGIYFANAEGEVIIDGNGWQRAIPWPQWRDGGAGGKYAAYRLRKGLSADEVRRLWTAANRYDGRPYDLKFAWGDDEIYCSELIWKSYRDALAGLEIGRLQRLRDFDLGSPLARPLIERKGSWGTVEYARVHGDEFVISPQAIADSALLQKIR